MNIDEIVLLVMDQLKMVCPQVRLPNSVVNQKLLKELFVPDVFLFEIMVRQFTILNNLD